jgi:hypothetical protein
MPTGSPLDKRLDLSLHIGMGKTGTSSIQQLLKRNREQLRDLGHLYPRSPGKARHFQIGMFITPDDELEQRLPWRMHQAPDPADFRRRFRRRLFREVNASGLSRVILSDEGLYSASDRALERLRRFTDRSTERVRVIVYLRRQDDHLISRYQQTVKTGAVERLSEWARQDHSRTYDYHARLLTWARIAEPTEFVVRRFERDSFLGGSLFQDFFDAVGVDARADQLAPVERRNESLDAEAVEFVRLLNVCQREDAGLRHLLKDNRALIARLAEGAGGPVLTLPSPVLDEFMTIWEDSNRRVAHDFLGDASGQLFRAPRKTTNTTTCQRLSPERIDHFLTLAELPEHTHAPLRRVAEREAVST